MKKQAKQLSGSMAIILAVMLTLLVGPERAAAEATGVPLPALSKAVKGEQCVEPADVMRREHMSLLKHQRDETLREGIRGKKYSLQECTECHATADPDIEEGKVRTLQPFCAQCHEYAAVKLDCFSCHNPTLPLQKSSSLPTKDDTMLQWMIASHLREGGSAGLESKTKQKELTQ